LTQTLLSHLAVGLAVSFIGSVPPGAINMTAVKISLEKGLRSVMVFALAAAAVEFIYALMAVYGANVLMRYPDLSRWMEGITVVLFLVLGLYYVLGNSHPAPVPADEPELARPRKLFGSGPFMKGLTLGLFNPLGIPFWLAYTSFLQLRQWIHLDPLTTFFYVFGIAAGAFIALILFGLLGKKINDKLSLSTQMINRSIGAVLLLLAVYKWVGVWWA
jgi:threonine/homoserine/homoserine lactone efflux protein